MKNSILQICVLFVLLVLHTGCTKIIKEPVYIPTKCDIDQPTRPAPTHSAAQNLKNILIYTEQLERDLKFCIKGE